MSRADVDAAAAQPGQVQVVATPPAPSSLTGGRPVRKSLLGDHGRFLRSELLMVFRRRRNLAILVVLGVVPILIGVAVKLGDHRERGDTIFGGITDNGLFAALAALLVVMPLFLPLGVAVVAGDAISGEASTGTLRYLLAVPVARTRLLAVKFGGILVWCAASVVVVAACGVIVGAILFPSGELTLLSGRTVSYAAGGYRLLLVCGYVAVSMAMVGALGLFVSTMTEVPVAAMAATLTLTIVSEVLDAVPQLSAVHPWLPSHYWLQWVDLLRDPMATGAVGHGLLVSGAYILIFLSLAWARFSGKDVTS
ncbi:MAG: type transport system permease protein [Pseudonocardiales bacterium]|nr:type transport system permease protein [Pseudonocardiales bacterium]